MKELDFVTDLKNELLKLNTNTPVVFLCIGTNKIIGDAFGPLVGNLLKEKLKEIPNISVIGSMSHPITYSKIEEVEEWIYKKHKNPYIICIDAALSKTIKEGEIVVRKEKTEFGRLLGKKGKALGDLSIKGVVAKRGDNKKQNFEHLCLTPMSTVLSMVNRTVNGIEYVYL